MSSFPAGRQVPAGVGLLDRLVGIVLWLGGAGVLSVLALSLGWLAFHAFFEAGVGRPGRIASWLAGSIGIGMAGALLSFPLAIAGATWTDPVRTGPVVRMCASLPLSIPAFLVCMEIGPWMESFLEIPARHPLWAVLALGCGGVAPQWLRFSRALALPGLARWREAALALGVPDQRVLSGIAFPAARRGIFAGWLRSLARGSGETMVVLLVAGHQADADWTAGAAMVTRMPHSLGDGGLWADLLRVAILLGAWTVLLHVSAAWLDRSQTRAASA